jgi:hypothetical protein
MFMRIRSLKLTSLRPLLEAVLKEFWKFFSGWDLWCFAGDFGKNGEKNVVFSW